MKGNRTTRTQFSVDTYSSSTQQHLHATYVFWVNRMQTVWGKSTGGVPPVTLGAAQLNSCLTAVGPIQSQL